AAALHAQLRGGVVAGTQPGVWFAATVPGLALPGFGTLDALLAASTVRLPAFDVLGTPADPTDDIAVEPGLTISAMSDLPVRFGPTPLRARLTANVQGPQLIAVTAGVDLNLDVVRPENGLPGVQRLSLTTLALQARIENGQPQ